MRKLLLLVGVAIGFILGSRAGRAPFEQIEANLRKIAGRSDVRKVTTSAKATVRHTADEAQEALHEKVDAALLSVHEAADETIDALHDKAEALRGSKKS